MEYSAFTLMSRKSSAVSECALILVDRVISNQEIGKNNEGNNCAIEMELEQTPKNRAIDQLCARNFIVYSDPLASNSNRSVLRPLVLSLL